MWRRHSAHRNDVMVIFTLEEQDASIETARSIANEGLAAVVVSVKGSSSIPAMSSIAKNWTPDSLVEGEERKQVMVKRRLRDLKEPYRPRSCKVLKGMPEAGSLGSDLVHGVKVTSSPKAGLIAASHADEVTGQLASTGAELVPTKLEFFNPEDERDKTDRVHENLVRVVQTETKTSKDFIIA